MKKQEAINILKEFHDKSALFSVRTALETVFPDLEESDDEKIRKAILNYFTKCWGNCKDDVCGIHVEDAIAWLEKQGSNLVKNGYTDNKDILKYADNYSHEIWHKLMDNFKNIKDYHIGCNDVSDIVLNAIIDAYNWLERQGEQKSSDEVLKIRQEVYQSGYNDGYKHGIEDVKQGEKKPIEWKDSDEKYLFRALLSIQKDIVASEISGVNTKDLNDCVKWLYSLKQRIKGE